MHSNSSPFVVELLTRVSLYDTTPGLENKFLATASILHGFVDRRVLQFRDLNFQDSIVNLKLGKLSG